MSKFALVAFGGMILNDVVLSLFSAALPQLAYGSALNTLTLKIAVALACMMLTFAAMSLLVFARKERKIAIPQGQLRGRFNRSISIVLPAYNEEANIGLTVKNAIDYLSTAVADYEIIVVNDGSKDNTREVVAPDTGISEGETHQSSRQSWLWRGARNGLQGGNQRVQFLYGRRWTI